MPIILDSLSDGLKQIRKSIRKIDKSVVCVGIAGGSASGKTFLSRKLSKSPLSMDDYFKELVDIPFNNFDTPDAYDVQLFSRHIKMLLNHELVNKPIYNFTLNDRIGYEKTRNASSTLIVEGCLVLMDNTSELFDIRVFINSSRSIRLQRRILRDTQSRDRSSEEVTFHFNTKTEPFHNKYVAPTITNADIIIHNHSQNLESK